jgi:HEAT repeat protein
LLVEAFKDENDDVWKLAKKVLLEIEVPEELLLPQILRALENKDKFVRQGAVYVMARFRGKGVAPLVKALRDSDPGVQARAADALDDIARRDPEMVRPKIADLVEAATGSPHEKVRRNALMALTTIHGLTDREFQSAPDKAVPKLIEMLDQGDKRWGAIKTLEAIGPPAKEAVPALARLAEDPDLNVSTAAAAALRRINPKKCWHSLGLGRCSPPGAEQVDLLQDLLLLAAIVAGGDQLGLEAGQLLLAGIAALQLFLAFNHGDVPTSL